MAHIGTSGWSYDHWEGLLYPEGFDTRQRLHAYGAAFRAVEVAATATRWPPVSTFAGWRDRLHEGFLMSVQAPRALALATRPRDLASWTGRIGESWAALGPKAGMLIVEVPAVRERDDAFLDALLAAMPEQVPVAVELRHDSWHVEDVFQLLEQQGATYCVMSGARLPCILRATSQRVFVRLHGPDHGALRAGSYYDDDLHWWAERIREWEVGGLEVFASFSNDVDGNAVRNAASLIELLG